MDSKSELKAFYDLQVIEDDNVLMTFTDENGNVVVFVEDDEPEKLGRYAARALGVRFVKSKPFTAYQDPTKKFRPAPGGVSVGHFNITAGTLGMYVKDKVDGSTSILSNNHVLANIDAGSPGDDILQPGRADGGVRVGDTIADLTRFIRLRGSGTKTVDAAIAKMKNESDVLLRSLSVGYVNGITPSYIDQKIWKYGRTSRLTRGTVVAVDATVQVGYGGSLTITLTDCIVSTIASQPGDSGSALVDFGSNEITGLLFAGNGTYTIGCKATNVFSLLNIEPIPAPAIERSLFLDLSHWNKPISSMDDDKEGNFKSNIVGLNFDSFSQMKDAGVRGIIVKACQPGVGTDPEFHNYYEYARMNNLLVSAYIFTDPKYSYNEHYSAFIEAVGDRKLDCPPSMDCEQASGQSVQAITSLYQNFGRMLTTWYGQRPLIYTGVSYWNTNVLPWSEWEQFPLWIAYWSNTAIEPTVPEAWKNAVRKWVIWQFDVNDNGRHFGVGSAQVDTNTTNKYFEELLDGITPPPISTSPSVPPPPISFSTSASPSPSPSTPPPNEKAVYEHYKGKATVNLNYRNGPGTQYTYLGTMKIGTEVEILETKPDATNNIWARIGYNEWAAQLYKGQEYIRYNLQSD